MSFWHAIKEELQSIGRLLRARILLDKSEPARLDQIAKSLKRLTDLQEILFPKIQELQIFHITKDVITTIHDEMSKIRSLEKLAIESKKIESVSEAVRKPRQNVKKRQVGKSGGPSGKPDVVTLGPVSESTDYSEHEDTSVELVRKPKKVKK